MRPSTISYTTVSRYLSEVRQHYCRYLSLSVEECLPIYLTLPRLCRLIDYRLFTKEDEEEFITKKKVGSSLEYPSGLKGGEYPRDVTLSKVLRTFGLRDAIIASIGGVGRSARNLRYVPGPREFGRSETVKVGRRFRDFARNALNTTPSSVHRDINYHLPRGENMDVEIIMLVKYYDMMDLGLARQLFEDFIEDYDYGYSEHTSVIGNSNPSSLRVDRGSTSEYYLPSQGPTLSEIRERESWRRFSDAEAEYMTTGDSTLFDNLRDY